MFEKNFLVEIGTEELPNQKHRAVWPSRLVNFTRELDNAGLRTVTLNEPAAPRRLAPESGESC